jgi:ATP-dependent Lon protease
LQVAVDSGAAKVLIPMTSSADLVTVPPELMSKFQISFYADPVDAAFKALGVS